MQERLQKIIARAGIASRRHAEQLILSGQVRVNGEVQMFVPTGFFRALTGTVREFLPNAPEPRLIAA